MIEKLGLKAGLKVTPPLKSGVTFTHFHIRGMGSMHGGGCRISGEISGPSLPPIVEYCATTGMLITKTTKTSTDNCVNACLLYVDTAYVFMITSFTS